MFRQIKHNTTVVRDEHSRTGSMFINSELGTIESEFSLLAEVKDSHFLKELERDLLDRLFFNQKEQEYEANIYY